MYAYGAVAVAGTSATHILIGIILLSGPEGADCVIGNAIIRAMDGIRWLAGTVMVLAAMAALYGLLTRNFMGLKRLWWLAPQQAVLAVTVIGVINAVVLQHYADGVYRPWQFILVDQLGWLAVFYIHGSGIVRRARDVQ